MTRGIGRPHVVHDFVELQMLADSLDLTFLVGLRRTAASLFASMSHQAIHLPHHTPSHPTSTNRIPHPPIPYTHAPTACLPALPPKAHSVPNYEVKWVKHNFFRQVTDKSSQLQIRQNVAPLILKSVSNEHRATPSPRSQGC